MLCNILRETIKISFKTKIWQKIEQEQNIKKSGFTDLKAVESLEQRKINAYTLEKKEVDEEGKLLLTAAWYLLSSQETVMRSIFT